MVFVECNVYTRMLHVQAFQAVAAVISEELLQSLPTSPDLFAAMLEITTGAKCTISNMGVSAGCVI